MVRRSTASHRPALVLPLVIIALAWALNLHGLAADSFWGDEILTASFASQPPAAVIRWTADDIHPPLYYLLAGRFTRLTASLAPPQPPSMASDWLWRFPSALAVVLAGPITFRLAHYLPRFGARLRLGPLGGMLLLSLAPTAIKYGQEARMHALFMLLSALSAWLFFRALSRPRRWPRWLLVGLVSAANIYTMYFGFLVLAAQGLTVLAYQLRSNRGLNLARLAGFSGAAGLAGLLYLPWWPVLLSQLRHRASVGAIEGGVGHPLEFMSGVVEALGPAPPAAAWGFFALFGLGLVLLARRAWPLALFSGLWLALPAALPLILGDPRALQFRYAFILPLYLPVAAYAVVALSHRLSAGWTPSLTGYALWILATVSFLSVLGLYQQSKPNWRAAAAYLNEQTKPGDIILIGPLWDEGRFISYYYRGSAPVLTPAAMVTNIEGRAAGLRASGGRVWAVNRFAPAETSLLKNIQFDGVVVSHPQLAVYEPALLTEAALDLAAQAVEAAYPWAAQAEAQGVLNPDPRTARAAALRAQGDTLLAAGHPAEAVEAYQTAVDIFPGWVNGFIALAEAQQAAGNVPAAVAAYRQAVAFNARWQGPAAGEAIALTEAGDWAAALKKYQALIYP